MLYPLRASPQPCLLVVEDERPLLVYLSALLNRDYRVLTAESASEAETLLNIHAIAVILCDHRLPGEQGLDFLRRMRRAHPATQAILLTGDAEAESFSGAIDEKIVLQILMKPSSLTEIRAAVEHALDVHTRCPQNRPAETERTWKAQQDQAPAVAGREARSSAPLPTKRRASRLLVAGLTIAAVLCLLGAVVVLIWYFF